MSDVQPFDLVKDPNTAQLVFAYESVLREMRTHSAGSQRIAEWVKRLDFHRDEFVRAAASPPAEKPMTKEEREDALDRHFERYDI